MKILAVCQQYPSADHKSVMAFVHTRNVYLSKTGHQVEVLSFAANKPYEWDGIKVFPASNYDAEAISLFDISFVHAPNVRNGLRFVLTYRRHLQRVCLVIHGHEFLDWMKYTPRDYDFMRSWKGTLRGIAQSIYDKIKLKIWNSALRSPLGKSLGVIFVSQWMKNHSEKCLRLSFDDLNIPNAVVENPIHSAFTKEAYIPGEKYANFVTIRPFDQPKYAIDLVVEMATRNPGLTFHVYGHGEYFKHYRPPSNMSVFEGGFRQEELPSLLGHYDCALLPTRVDAQGVLMCEIASLGMPILTSDLEICREMLGEFSNASFFSNSKLDIDRPLPLRNQAPPKSRFAQENTVSKELDFAINIPCLGGATALSEMQSSRS